MATDATHNPLPPRHSNTGQEQLSMRSKEDLETAESLLDHSQSGRLPLRSVVDDAPLLSHNTERSSLPVPSPSAQSDVATFRTTEGGAELESPASGYAPHSSTLAEQTPPPGDTSITGQVCV